MFPYFGEKRFRLRLQPLRRRHPDTFDQRRRRRQHGHRKARVRQDRAHARIEAIEDEGMLAHVEASGIKYGQGPVFAEPSPVKAEIMASQGAAACRCSKSSPG